MNKGVFFLQGGDSERPKYHLSKWYTYTADKLIANHDNIKEAFPNRHHINADDIVEYIVHSKYGAHVTIDAIKRFKSLLGRIEEKIVTGKWKNNNVVTVCPLTSHNIDIYINNITNVTLLSELTDAIHEQLYISYFVEICPDIYLPEPRVPNFPPTTKNYVDVDNYDAVKDLVKNNLMYIKMLELYHTRIFALVETASRGLLQVLSY